MNKSKLAKMKLSTKLLEELLIRNFGHLSIVYENGNEKSRMDFFTSGLPKDFKIEHIEAEKDLLSIIFKSDSNKEFDDDEKIPERDLKISTQLMNCFACDYCDDMDYLGDAFYCRSFHEEVKENSHIFFCANHKFKGDK